MASMATTVHLVRHGSVENPKGIIYGRLPGYHLSEAGRRQAEAAARRLAEADVASVWSSPLERARETAETIASPHGLDIIVDDRFTESETTLEGISGSLLAFVANPLRWWSLRNPVRPSWGESFSDTRLRMLEGIADAVERSEGREAVIVSHQTPVLVARLALTRRRMPPWLSRTPCETGSVTTLVLDGDDVVSASYFRPPAAH
jgi:broad specificity phosphatase PhoE